MRRKMQMHLTEMADSSVSVDMETISLTPKVLRSAAQPNYLYYYAKQTRLTKKNDFHIIIFMHFRSLLPCSTHF